jgi:hypothetical protein
MPNTKIVATLRPASDAPSVLHRLLDAGVDVFRLNASHGTRQKHAERIAAARKTANELESILGFCSICNKRRRGCGFGCLRSARRGQLDRGTPNNCNLLAQ